jgi:diguanylate cyclase (GGDEF)-like protein
MSGFLTPDKPLAGAAPPTQLAQLWLAVDRSDHATVDSVLASLEAGAGTDTALLARARAAASHALYRRSQLADAAKLAATALELARQSGQAQASAEALVAWARIEWAAGNLDEALRHLEEAALLALPDARLQCHQDNLLGLVHADLGQFAESESFHRRALATARRHQKADLEMMALTNLAGRLLVRGEAISTQSAEAQAVWDELDRLVNDAEALALRSDLELALPNILVSHAASWIARGDSRRAHAAFARQRALIAEHPDRSSLPHAAAYRARLFQAEGLTDAARESLREGVAEARSMGAKAREASLHLAASALEEQLANYHAALQHHKRYAALREECALEGAHRKATALALRMQTARALREAADQRQRAQQLAESNHVLREQADALSRVAYRDALTGLANRRELERSLPAMHQTALHQRQPLALVLLDVDHFKLVNDSHSHAVGDRVLEQLGQLLVSHFREQDLCVRYGGEEFVVALPKINALDTWGVCERLRQRVQNHDWAAVHPGLQVTISQGFAMLGDAAECASPEAWTAALQRADERLYAAKRAGRNQVIGPMAARRSPQSG